MLGRRLHTKPDTSARLWPPIARFIEREQQIGRWAQHRGPMVAGLYEFIRFGVKQGWACLFGGLMVALLIGTHVWYPRGAVLSRYDFLVIAAVAIQAALLTSKMELWEEAKVILLFHLVGTAMELFKTSVGSWTYPEPSLLRISGVPLFTGFMYAAVGSYLARVWRLFDFRFTHHPPLWATLALSAAIYINFFAHHYVADLRLVLLGVTTLLFARTWVYFRIWQAYRRMPLLVGFFLVAVFIWFAENVGTITGTWLYPNQRAGWAMVPFAKLSSWFLLMIISYVMVSAMHWPRGLASSAAGDIQPKSAG